jgi:hypothetical protein
MGHNLIFAHDRNIFKHTLLTNSMPRKYAAISHGGHFHCVDPGDTCTAPAIKDGEVFFVHPKFSTDMQKEIHDNTLSKLTDDMNNLIKQAAEKRKDKSISFVNASKGLVPVWCDASDHPKDENHILLDTDDKRMKFFGLER